MSLAILYSRALAGMGAPSVTVEAHLANGLPAFNIVGLPDTEVKESRDRVRAALTTAGFDFPARRITVNLAPADLPKESGRFDLPIALGILAASGQIPAEALAGYEFAGELALTGALRPVRGALPMSVQAVRAGRAFVLPLENAAEAALAEGADIYGAASLLQVCAHLAGRERLARQPREDVSTSESPNGAPDLGEIKGQAHAKRALEVAAAGSHSLLMVGPPGTGKSMLAARLPGLLPPMTEAEALAAASVQSLGQGGFRRERWRARPYRAPHHSASGAALVGGGGTPRPGEISLAHGGVLFLDELPEFDRKVLEALREPLESGRVSISRASAQVEFPAEFQLIAAMNPCPCGYLGHASGRCRCTPDVVARYRARLSGPLLDRIDLQIEVPALPQEDLLRPADGESSAAVRARVGQAHGRQMARQGRPNARLTPREVERVCPLEADGERLLKAAIRQLDLSARGYHRVLQVARTVADLAGSHSLTAAHVAEAVQYRRFDRRA